MHGSSTNIAIGQLRKVTKCNGSGYVVLFERLPVEFFEKLSNHYIKNGDLLCVLHVDTSPKLRNVNFDDIYCVLSGGVIGFVYSRVITESTQPLGDDDE